jgi:group I intron endonuclease
MKKIGIYCIKNVKNGKIYVGSSSDILNRIRQHKNQLKMNVHGNNHLQSSYNKYGMSCFNFSILKITSEECKISNEIYYIHKLNCLNPKIGYNKASIIENTSGYKWSEASRLKLSKSKKGTKMHPNTLASLIKANTGSKKNPIWLKTKESIDRNSESHKKSILQYDLLGNFIREWKSSIDAGNELGYNSKGISNCVRGVRRIVGNYQWLPKIGNKYPLKITEYRRKYSIHKDFLRLCSEMNIEKQGELLESPIKGNQQPSLTSNSFEGSTTNSQIQTDNAEDGNTDKSALPLHTGKLDSNPFAFK